MPEFRLGRLRLRALRRSDAEDMFEYSKDPKVTSHLLWDPHPDLRYTSNYLKYVDSQYRKHRFYEWAVVWEETGKMIGTCGFNYFDRQNSRAEIGYVINPVFWNRGVATEAVSFILRIGFDKLGLNRIEARHMVGNDASRRVMEKNHMTFEGIMRSAVSVREVFRDVAVFSILRHDYYQFY